MKLMVIRHGHAKNRQRWRGSEEARPLTGKGRRLFKRRVRIWAEEIEAPSLILTSPLLRTLQTARLLREEWPGLSKCRLQEMDELRPDCDLQRFLSRLRSLVREWPSEATLAVVGHEDDLSRWLCFLTGTGCFTPMTKGSAVLIEIPRSLRPGSAKVCVL